MLILVINAGSSSIKYLLAEFPGQKILAHGAIERIGEQDGSDGPRDHAAALNTVVEQFEIAAGRRRELARPAVIGHRVVHGGARFSASVLIDDAVTAAIADLIPLAPLHNPANLQGIQVCRQRWPEVPQVAVFDTAYHQTMSPVAYRYALPKRLYSDYGIRRYGFHGTSHRSVARRAADYLKRPLTDLNLITLHLGNGCSACAIRNGQSADTSMGMTPLEGLMMGSRSGDVDPGIAGYLSRRAGVGGEAYEHLLNFESGLRGVAGDNDMRDLHRRAAADDADAQLAVDMFCYRVRKCLGAYMFALGRVDAVVFTGGIGCHDGWVRSRILRDLERYGIVLAEQPNSSEELTAAASPTRVLVFETDEEIAIAAECYALVAS